jgi:glyoxylase-like metal-dependent hydrolase (beta-lactamase superfamily II)
MPLSPNREQPPGASLNPLEARLTYPHQDRIPAAGEKIELAPGVFWIRFPLPFALDHINLWLLRDQFEGRDGFTLIDCGIASQTTRDMWEEIIAKALEGLPLVRIIATHTHPDHIGNAAWLGERFGAPLWMTVGEYTMGRVLQAGLVGTDGPSTARHFAANGLSDATHLAKMRERTNYFSNMVPSMPSSFHRIVDGDVVNIGGQNWHIIDGYGHSPEHASLYCESLQVLISGDMLLPRISTNISVHALEPEANPVQQFLDSIKRYVPLDDDTLVLPSHGKPFLKLHERVLQLNSHHDERLAEVMELCRSKPTTGADVVPVMFKRPLDSHQIFFAFGEALAHLHCLWYRASVKRTLDGGVYYFSAD